MINRVLTCKISPCARIATPLTRVVTVGAQTSLEDAFRLARERKLWRLSSRPSRIRKPARLINLPRHRGLAQQSENHHHHNPSEGTTFRVVFPMTTARGRGQDPNPAPSDPPPSPITAFWSSTTKSDNRQYDARAHRAQSRRHRGHKAGSARHRALRPGFRRGLLRFDDAAHGWNRSSSRAFVTNDPGSRDTVFMTGGAFTTRAAEFLASIDNRRVWKPFSLGMVEQIVSKM